MKIVATADLHGHLPRIPRADLLLLAGDILPDDDQEEWVRGSFRNWVRNLPVRRTVFIAGNHDFYFQSAKWHSWGPEYFKGLGATYLQDELVQIGDLSIWGTPWVEELPCWAFSEGREYLRNVPEADIVLAHSPPAGILDLVGQKNVGSSALSAALQKNTPRAVFFGHIHECGGQMVQQGTTNFYNVALCDKKMQPTGEPLFLDQPL